MIVLTYGLESSQGKAWGGRAHARPNGLTELRKQNWESGKDQVAKVYRVEITRRESHT